MSPPSDLLKIGEFAKLAHTNLRTLRYYEELGLLSPAHRSEGGFRYYRPTDLARIRLIHFLQELGLQLERIGELVLHSSKGVPRAKWIAHLQGVLGEHRELIDARIAALNEQRSQVDDSLEHLKNCGACELTPSEDNNFCEPCSSTSTPLPEFLSAIF